MQHVTTGIAGTAGVLIGVVTGVGATTLLTAEAAPDVQERTVFVPAYPGPEQPDRLVQWLKQHPRNR